MLQTQSHDPSTVTRCIRRARGVRKGAWLHSIGYVYSQKLQLSLWAVAFAAIRPSTSLGDTVVYVFRVTFASDTQPQLTNVEFYSNVLSIYCYGVFVSVFRVASSRIQETEATLYYLSLSLFLFVCLFTKWYHRYSHVPIYMNVATILLRRAATPCILIFLFAREC